MAALMAPVGSPPYASKSHTVKSPPSRTIWIESSNVMIAALYGSIDVGTNTRFADRPSARLIAFWILISFVAPGCCAALTVSDHQRPVTLRASATGSCRLGDPESTRNESVSATAGASITAHWLALPIAQPDTSLGASGAATGSCGARGAAFGSGGGFGDSIVGCASG